MRSADCAWGCFASVAACRRRRALVPASHAFRRMVWRREWLRQARPARLVRRAERVDTPKIRDAKDVEQAVRAAIASEQPLEIIGHGTKRQIGQPMATNAVLDLVGAQRRHLLRAERADHHGAGRRAAGRRDVADQLQEPAIRLRADGHRAAARHAGDRHHRRHDRGGARRAAPDQGRRRARPSARCACRVAASATASRPAARW